MLPQPLIMRKLVYHLFTNSHLSIPAVKVVMFYIPSHATWLHYCMDVVLAALDELTELILAKKLA